ncbi:restriction endonuclease subunit S [Micromonospora chalcea]|uniref:restriction endonuclease subunit S n=1 Tax=Micromonospora chalcea TaxID=1874 RepID=UPI00380B86F5
MSKRYTEYVDSGVPWLGDVPAGWTMRPLWSMFERIKDVGHPEEQMLSVFRDYGVVAKDSRGNINKTAENRNIYQLVHPGWLVTNRMKAWQGSVGISGLRGIVSGHYICFAPRHDADSRYLNWLFRSPAYATGYGLLSRGVRIGQAEIDNDLYRVMPVLLPPIEEQRAIAGYLDRETARIDTLIEEQQRLIEMLCERRTAAIAVCLESLGGMTRLKHVSTVQTGVTLSGEGDPTSPEWSYLRVANVQVGYVDLREIKTVRVPPKRAAASMLQTGDVLMTEGGDIDKLGRGALWRGEVPNMLHQNHIFAVRPSEALDSEFLVWWLDGPVARTYFRTTAKQTTNLAGTNRWTLGNLPVPVPPLNEQRRVVEALREQTTKINALITETERFIELARERRAALITAAVTGQFDVREMA